jgi:hypothetical protein
VLQFGVRVFLSKIRLLLCRSRYSIEHELFNTRFPIFLLFLRLMLSSFTYLFAYLFSYTFFSFLIIVHHHVSFVLQKLCAAVHF